MHSWIVNVGPAYQKRNLLFDPLLSRYSAYMITIIFRAVSAFFLKLYFDLNNTTFWDVTPCGSYKNQHFGGMYRLHHQGDKDRLANVLQLLFIANIPSSPILVTLMMETINFSKTLFLTRATWHNIPEDGILHSYHHENLKSFMYLSL
jgi:hypothetical protein